MTSSKKWFPDGDTSPVEFSSDSNLVAVGVSHNQEVYNAAIAFFNNQGRLLFSFPFPVSSVNNIAISLDNQYLVATGIRVYLPYDQGKADSLMHVWNMKTHQLLWAKVLPAAGYALSFSKDGNHFIAAPRIHKHAYFIRTTSGDVEWEFPEKKLGEFGFTDALIQNSFILLSGEQRENSMGIEKLYILDLNGNLIGSKEFSKAELLHQRVNSNIQLFNSKIAVMESNNVQVLDYPVIK